MKKKDSEGVSRTPLFSSSAEGPYRKVHCDDCDKNIVLGSTDKFCPFCYSEVNPEEGKVLKAEFHASVEHQKARFICSICEKEIYTTLDKPDEEIINCCYCPACGSSEIEACEEVQETKEEGSGDEPKVEDIEEPENQVEMEEGSEIEAAMVSSPEPTWFLFKSGKPILKITKSKVHADAHPIFATESFVEMFKARVEEASLISAIKDFNAEVVKDDEVINSLDLEKLAFDRLQSQVIPKFQDCLALAIEGSAKGVYPNLNKELKASFYDELVARGLPETKCQEAIEAAFLSAGTDVFMALVAKATELMYKPDNSFKELKATIQSAGIVHGKPTVTEDDLEKKEVRERLSAGNLPLQNLVSTTDSLTAPFALKSVQSFRDRISFRKSNN